MPSQLQNNSEITGEDLVNLEEGESRLQNSLTRKELDAEVLENQISVPTTFKSDESCDQEVSAKRYLFRNAATGAVWFLSVQDDLLLIKVPNYSFQISPSSSNKFIPVNTLVNLEIELEQPAQNQNMLMHLYAKGIKRATFEAI